MFEHRRHPVISRRRFAVRLAKCAGSAAALVTVSLAGGAVGYRATEGLSWLDATYSAALILTGMGPARELQHPGAKVFAIFYALFSGVLFVAVTALLLAPVLHRLLHTLHLEADRGG